MPWHVPQYAHVGVSSGGHGAPQPHGPPPNVSHSSVSGFKRSGSGASSASFWLVSRPAHGGSSSPPKSSVQPETVTARAKAKVSRMPRYLAITGPSPSPRHHARDPQLSEGSTIADSLSNDPSRSGRSVRTPRTGSSPRASIRASAFLMWNARGSSSGVT